MVAVVQLKGCVAGAGIFRIIISKFSHQKEPCSVVLLEINEGTKVGFHCAVLPLGLAVNLRIEGCGKSPFNSEKVTKQ